ncbi:putative tick transposon [Operophtera brumata]|uniref:Putative tick transposon n=1 Tax=Operophtera brumata TaxID=104452 RepID=A0A0L7L5X3_OPEBR|nr:putative tick transposon [Operophtera brumata]
MNDNDSVQQTLTANVSNTRRARARRGDRSARGPRQWSRGGRGVRSDVSRVRRPAAKLYLREYAGDEERREAEWRGREWAGGTRARLPQDRSPSRRSPYLAREDEPSPAPEERGRSASAGAHHRARARPMRYQSLERDYDRSYAPPPTHHPEDEYYRREPPPLFLGELQSQNSDLQRELGNLKKELELTNQKLGSSMHSIKTFWSPELKKERALRKEESANYPNPKLERDNIHAYLRNRPTVVSFLILLIVKVNETWIQNETQAKELQLPNYTHYYNYRTDKTGGGVSAFVHNNLNHSLSESNYLDGNNYLWIRLEKFAREVGLVYNPGHTNYKRFLETYDSQLQLRKRAIVFGDFNIDLLKKKKEIKQYKAVLKEAGFGLLNKISKKYCTRHSTTRKSIIDHVSSNLKNNNFHMAIINSSLSDHKQIYVELKKFKPIPKIQTKYEAIDYTKLHATAKEDKIDDLNDFTLLENKIKEYMQDSKTIKMKILNKPQKDWINKDILTGINQRNYIWTEHKKNPEDESLETEFKTKRDRTAKLIRDTKNSYYYKEFTKCINKPKHMWNLINKLVNNKGKESCAPPKLMVDSKLITNSCDICEVFNQYFSTIGPLLAEQIPMRFHENFNVALPHTTNASVLCTLDPCSADEINKIIDHLDSNSSSGLD